MLVLEINGKLFKEFTNFKIHEFYNYLKINKIVIVIILYLIFSVTLFSFRGLSNHDTLVYALTANAISESTTIEYSSYKYLDLYGILKADKHGYGYPMFKVIENLLNINNSNSDFYYRFIPLVNGGYLILLVYLFLKEKVNEIVALYSSALLLFSGSFIFLIATYGSSSISYVLFLLSNIYIYELLTKKKSYNLLLFSMTVGLGATVHSINLIILPVQIILYLLLVKQNIFKSMEQILIFTILIQIFGVSNYLFEIIWGDGWIFGAKFNFLTKVERILDLILKML
ncbi:MAG: glycosyltransferase family 39 protein [Ignavibacteriae bacterium]|nr:glycosyltransferase family 39 protein [Ignavibacteriota bacterium]